VTRYRGEVKYVIARSVLADLDARGAAGRRVQWQIVDNMLGLNGPADRDADADAAKASLKTLRDAAEQGDRRTAHPLLGPREPARPEEARICV
jgi:hypothetical protein